MNRIGTVSADIIQVSKYPGLEELTSVDSCNIFKAASTVNLGTSDAREAETFEGASVNARAYQIITRESTSNNSCNVFKAASTVALSSSDARELQAYEVPEIWRREWILNHRKLPNKTYCKRLLQYLQNCRNRNLRLFRCSRARGLKIYRRRIRNRGRVRVRRGFGYSCFSIHGGDKWNL